jgi:hypothetical protein
MRLTEEYSALSYRTSTEEDFRRSLEDFARQGNHTPLRQRYYWKLVGRVVLSETATRIAGALERSPPSLADLPALSLETASVRIREGFPSDTYARANGRLGVLQPEPRRVLRALVEAPWLPVGPPADSLARPTRATVARLGAVRSRLAAAIARDGALTAMSRQRGNPVWGDLLDAFALAFVGCCEDHRASVFLGTADPRSADRLRAEGAILAPAWRAIRG